MSVPAAVKSRQLYEQLRGDLVGGRFGPGEKLSELALVNRFGVSRTPVREALARLEQDGLLRREGAHFLVPIRTMDEILDLYDVRAQLSAFIADYAARRRSEADLVVLERINADARKLPARSAPAKLVESNRSFHDALSVAAHNPVLTDLQRRLDFQVADLPLTTLTHSGRWKESLNEHEALTAAISGRDAGEAARIGEAHLRRAREIWLERMRTSS